MVATLTQLFEWRAGRPIAFGSFSVTSREDMLGVVDAAEAAKIPVILQGSAAQLGVAGVRLWAAEALEIASRSSVMVCVHLDHGGTFEICCQALRNGFTSVMRDGSSLVLDDNIAQTRAVADAAHAMGVSCEGEVGHIGGVEDGAITTGPDQRHTDPDDAERFVAETGVDALAIGVGNVHGVPDGTVVLDIERAREIQRRLPVPIVLHGGSGLDAAQFSAMIRAGVAKINIGTEVKLAHIGAWQDALRESPRPQDPRLVLPKVRDAVRRVAAKNIAMFSQASSP